LISSRERWLSG